MGGPANNGRRDAWPRREGAAALVVVAVFVAGLLLYGRSSIRQSNTMRADAALASGQAIAAAVAATVDERAAGLEEAVRAAARREGLAAADSPGAGPALARVLAAVQADDATLTGLALYGADGRRAAATSQALPRTVPPGELSAWATADTGRIVALPDGTGALALTERVRVGGQVRGYLVGWRSLSLRDVPALEAALSDAGQAVLLVARDGRVPASWGDPEQTSEMDAPFAEAAALAREHGAGHTVIFTHDNARRRLVGYALSRRTGLAVVSSQLGEHALAPSRYLVGRLLNMAVPTAALIGVAAWMLFMFYYRERQLSLTLAEHNTRLNAEARAGSDLLANVSHDLRTPIAALRIAITGLLDTTVQWDAASARETLETARGQLDRLAAKVRNLLEMARLESGRQAPRKEMCDLTDVVDGALHQLRPLLNGRRIETDFPEQPILVECDQAQIETVVVNLIENALKYSPPCSPLYLSGAGRGGQAVVSVRDTGPGIPPGDERRVFQKFYRGQNTAQVGGAGLGLAICRSIIEGHEGTIEARTAPEGGAVFSFALPMPLIEMSGSPVVEVAP